MATKHKQAQQEERKQRETGQDMPEGFDALNMDMPSVHWEQVSEVQGTVLDSDLYITPTAVKRVLVIELDGEPHRLYEQPGIRRLFNKAMLGDTIYIKTTGKRTLPNGRSLRTFQGGIRFGTKRVQIKWPAMPQQAPTARRGADMPDDDVPF